MGLKDTVAQIAARKRMSKSQDDMEEENTASEDQEEQDKQDYEAEDGEDETKEKKSKSKSEDDKDDQETIAEDDEEDQKSASSYRAQERKRIQAILECRHAENNPSLAAHLAFKTDMSAENANEMLQASGVDASSTKNRSSLSERMKAENIPDIGANAGESKSEKEIRMQRIMKQSENKN